MSSCVDPVSGDHYVVYNDVADGTLPSFTILKFNENGVFQENLGTINDGAEPAVGHPSIACGDTPMICYRSAMGQGSPQELYIRRYVDGQWQHMGTNPVLTDNCQQAFVATTGWYTVLLGVSSDAETSQTFVWQEDDWEEIQTLPGKADDLVANPHDGYFYTIVREGGTGTVWRIKPFETDWEQVGTNAITGVVQNRAYLRIQETTNTIWVVPGTSFQCAVWRFNPEADVWDDITVDAEQSGPTDLTFVGINGAEVPLRICMRASNVGHPRVFYLDENEQWVLVDGVMSFMPFQTIDCLVHNGIPTVFALERKIPTNNAEVISTSYRVLVGRQLVLRGTGPQPTVIVNAADDSCPTDLDGNGIINAGDLTILLSDFGTVCE